LGEHQPVGDRRQNISVEQVKVGLLAKELRVVRRDQVDQLADLSFTARRLEEFAVVPVVIEPEMPQPLPEAAGHQRVLIGSEPDPTALVDQPRQEVVCLRGERSF
jgi:hypothetical protein